MNLDDDVCVCFHVSLRKLQTYARREQPRHASQMSDCLNAGTGCGWCIPVLCKIHAAALAGREFKSEQTPAEYAAQRLAYRTEHRPRHEFEGPRRDKPPPSPPSEPDSSA